MPPFHASIRQGTEMDIRHLPHPQQRLPARWQPYAAWLAAQDNPPLPGHAHPVADEQEWADLQQAFVRHMGLPLAQYIRLKRTAFVLAQRHAADAAYAAELAVSTMHTPLGPMLAVFGDVGLCLLEFFECQALERELLALQQTLRARFAWRETAASRTLQHELDQYFAGKLQQFGTALHPVGTPFQQAVWRSLQAIPYGETRSYKAQAEHLGQPRAVRAVAAANGQNKIAILIPCHRVIGSNGQLVGYAGGLARKQALLKLESAQAEMTLQAMPEPDWKEQRCTSNCLPN